MFLPSSGETGAAAYSCTFTSVSSVGCTHNLGNDSPAVWYVDSAGNYLGSSGTTSSIGIISLTSNSTRITFSGLTTGKCKLSTGGQGPVGATGATGATGPQGSTTGDVLGPATNTSGNIPIWDGNNSKKLAAGISV